MFPLYPYGAKIKHIMIMENDFNCQYLALKNNRSDGRITDKKLHPVT
jgi:hypothetical protein